jgi:16S rRNA (uracil1498-N3)-methyltransferase
MTRRRFYAPSIAFDFDEKTVILSADEARHARDVLRLRGGDEIYVFDGAGKEFRCALREFVNKGAVLDLKEEVEPARPDSSLDLTLAIALLKGEKFDLVIQKTIELGVRRVVPLISERADVHLSDRVEQRRVNRWRRIALEAAKQCGRACIPEVAAPASVGSFLAKSSETKTDSVARLFFAERDGKSLNEVIEISIDHPIQILTAVGPEGGWADREIEYAREAGWEIVTLGGRILRAETAAIAVVTLLQHRFGDLN